MNLYTDHLKIGERLEHTRFAQLRDAGHRPEYTDVRVVHSESSDVAYLVARVECLATPFGPDSDVVADKTTVTLCSCPQFNYRLSAGFEDGENNPPWKKCKHGIAAYRAEQAQADDQQTELDQ